jgi:hypothetical protein
MMHLKYYGFSIVSLVIGTRSDTKAGPHPDSEEVQRRISFGGVPLFPGTSQQLQM